MIRYEDLIGQRFGRLVVIERSGSSKDGKSLWRCMCDCGNICVVPGYNLKSKNTRSCGCLRREKTISRSTRHGMCNERLYRIWSGIKERCTNPKNKYYKNYGERGIYMCAEWDKLECFAQWAFANGYNEHLSIDRIDVNGGYTPENCRWATPKVQNNNRRNNRVLTHNGLSMTIAQWAEYLGLNSTTIWMRLSRGWDVERALTAPKSNNAAVKAIKRLIKEG